MFKLGYLKRRVMSIWIYLLCLTASTTFLEESSKDMLKISISLEW